MLALWEAPSLALGEIRSEARAPYARVHDIEGGSQIPIALNSPVPAFPASILIPPQRPVLLVMEAEA